MKKSIIIFLAISLLLSGCTTTKTNNSSTSGSTASNAASTSGYSITIQGMKIHMHDEVAPILAKLGKSMQYFEAKSCAFPGLEKTYTYSGFSLLTYESNGLDRVASIILLDDSLSTDEGLFLGDSLDKVKQFYGDKYTKSLDLYTFESGKMKLNVLLEKNTVASIEYIALADK